MLMGSRQASPAIPAWPQVAMKQLEALVHPLVGVQREVFLREVRVLGEGEMQRQHL